MAQRYATDDLAERLRGDAAMLNDPRTIDRATWLIWVAHNLERIGDRVQNICERTIYEVTGVMKEFTYRGGDPGP